MAIWEERERGESEAVDIIYIKTMGEKLKLCLRCKFPHIFLIKEYLKESNKRQENETQ